MVPTYSQMKTIPWEMRLDTWLPSELTYNYVVIVFPILLNLFSIWEYKRWEKTLLLSCKKAFTHLPMLAKLCKIPFFKLSIFMKNKNQSEKCFLFWNITLIYLQKFNKLKQFRDFFYNEIIFLLMKTLFYI